MIADPGYATLKISQVVFYHSLAIVGAVLTIFATAFMMLEGMFVDSSKFCLP